MREIVEHFCIGFLAALVTLSILGMYVSFLHEGGVFYTTTVNFMKSICG